jgi:hypothetical protein
MKMSRNDLRIDVRQFRRALGSAPAGSNLAEDEDASMRATLEILADEFLAHANNQDQPWATADAIKTLYQDLEKAKEEKERYWI